MRLRNWAILMVYCGTIAISLVTVGAVLADCVWTPNSAGGSDVACTGDTDGVVDGTAGNDNLTNDGNLDGYIWGGDPTFNPNQSDTIINNGTVGDGLVNPATNDDDDGLWGSTGGDTIINNGTVNGGAYGAITGDGWITGAAQDHDTIINNGTVNGDISGDLSMGGDDTIIVNGTVNGSVYGDASATMISLGGTADGGDDTIIIQDNGVVTGVMDGGPGTDVLEFSFQIVDHAEYTTVMNTLSGANAGGGSLSYGGFVFQWLNFEQLINLVQFIGLVQNGQITIEELVRQWNAGDGRLNHADAAASAAVYCQDGSVHVLDINEDSTGGASFLVTAEQIQAALPLAVNGGEHVMVAEGHGHSLWALSSYELQVHSATYDFIFHPDRCVA